MELAIDTHRSEMVLQRAKERLRPNDKSSFDTVLTGFEEKSKQKTADENQNDGSQQSNLDYIWSPLTPLVNTGIHSEVSAEKVRGAAGASGGEKIVLGEISRKSPTVSHLLDTNDDLRSQMWNILFSRVNNSKEFERLPFGTKVWIDSGSKEISWDANVSRRENLAVNELLFHDNTSGGEEFQIDNKELVSLGRIDGRNTTVSHLLASNGELKDNGWQILASDINRNKSFRTIAEGTEVFLNAGSGEISWKTAEDNESAKLAATSHKKIYPVVTPFEQNKDASDLSNAVKKYLGRSYQDINCYELVVKGLQDLNVRYSGKGGLQTMLTRMATDQGMAANAYLNGEGIVKAAGSTVFSENYPVGGDWREKAENLLRYIEPLLEDGQILSFSTPRRGHTGVVSQTGEQWTFVNSGRLDNSIESVRVKKGVGEEVLKNEIRNWFRLAHNKREELSVTLGRLEKDKLQVLTASAARRYEDNRI